MILVMQWPLFFLISLIIFWSSLTFMLIKWPRISNKSISRHSASYKEAYIFFTAVQVFAGIASLLFIKEWFIPHFSLPLVFKLAIYLTITLQLLAAVLPDKEVGRVSKFHLHIANMMALGILVCTTILASQGDFNMLVRSVFILSMIYMVICAIMIGAKKGKPEQLGQYLYLQVVYVFVFHASILMATYY